MTQVLINSLNNLQDSLMTNVSKENFVKKGVSFESSFDFNKVFNNKLQNKTNSTIAGITNKNSQNSEGLSYFKEVLDRATKDSKAESSLDLTLSRDINEVIDNFKKFVEKANEDGAISIDERVLEKLKNGEVDEEVGMLFAQYVALMSTKVSQNSVLAEDLSAFKEQLNSLLTKATATFETAEVVSKAVAEKVTSTVEESAQKEVDSVLDDELLKELNIESMDSDTSSFEGDSLMQRQTAEEQGLKAMLNQDVEVFDIKVDKAVNVQNTQTAQTAQAKPIDVNPSKILAQIAKQLDGLQANSKVNIVLNPESLGKVNIQLMSTKDGLMAQFTVATTEARDILMKGLDGLKESLLSHGVNVDNVSVKMSEAQKSEYNADWTEQEGSRGGNKGQGQPNREEKEKGLFEKMMTQAEFNENGNV